MGNAVSVLKELLASHPHAARLGLLAALTIVIRYYSKGSAKLLSGIEQLDGREYDIVVVGGGTSGCALAARLSEDPKLKVLLLEAGGSGKALPYARMPIGFGRLFRGKHIFNLYTEPQVHAAGQQRYWPRAKLLGGCSQINAQMAQYGAPQDFDDWADIIGDPSWSWAQFSKYFKKFETFKPDKNYPTVDLTARGSSGPIRVGYFGYKTPASKAFIKACMRIGIPFTPDFNNGKSTMGVSPLMTYIDEKYHRVSSESAYLTDDVLSRPNLTVAIHASATRVLLETGEGKEPRAVGVEFAKSKDGPKYRVCVRKEVIMSSGAVHSPHVLMLSGLGPAAHLSAHNITPILDIPGIGQNLVDHPVIDTYFKDKRNASLKYMQPQSAFDHFRVLRDTARWILGYGGPIASNFGDSAAFVRTDDPVLFPSKDFGPPVEVDSSAGLALGDKKHERGPDLELFCTPFAYKDHGLYQFDMHTFALHAYLLRPTSRGEVLLKSKDPWELPSVNPNYLQTPEDLKILCRGMRILLRIAQTEPLADFLDQNEKDILLDHELHLKTLEELKKVVTERVETVYHPASTCRMAPKDQGGVVDGQLRVYGVKGLRVCDASIFPYIVSGHTAGACYATAEKLADIVKAEYV